LSYKTRFYNSSAIFRVFGCFFIQYFANLTHRDDLLQWATPAGVAELVDAADSKSVDGDIVGVRFSPSAPNKHWFFQGFLFILY
jgi:hypothetical protein